MIAALLSRQNGIIVRLAGQPRAFRLPKAILHSSTSRVSNNRSLSGDTIVKPPVFASVEDEIRYANANQNNVMIRPTPGDGYGIFAMRDFRKWDLVMRAKALSFSNEQGTHTIQTDWNTHVYMDLPARFVNHSCGEATVGIQANAFGAYDFVALSTIVFGQEIRWDYEASEYEMVADFFCRCGSRTCRRRLRGFRYHGRSVIQAYGEEYIAPYLLRKL